MKKRKFIVSLLLTFGLIVHFSSTMTSLVHSPTQPGIVTFEDKPIDGKH